MLNIYKQQNFKVFLFKEKKIKPKNSHTQNLKYQKIRNKEKETN